MRGRGVVRNIPINLIAVMEGECNVALIPATVLYAARTEAVVIRAIPLFAVLAEHCLTLPALKFNFKPNNIPWEGL